MALPVVPSRIPPALPVMAPTKRLFRLPPELFPERKSGPAGPREDLFPSRLPIDLIREIFDQLVDDQTSQACLAVVNRHFASVAVVHKLNLQKISAWSWLRQGWAPSEKRFCEICQDDLIVRKKSWDADDWYFVRGAYKQICKFETFAWFDFEVVVEGLEGGFMCPKHKIVTRTELQRRCTEPMSSALQWMDVIHELFYFISHVLQLHWFTLDELFGYDLNHKSDDIPALRYRHWDDLRAQFITAAFQQTPSTLSEADRLDESPEDFRKRDEPYGIINSARDRHSLGISVIGFSPAYINRSLPVGSIRIDSIPEIGSGRTYTQYQSFHVLQPRPIEESPIERCRLGPLEWQSCSRLVHG